MSLLLVFGQNLTVELLGIVVVSGEVKQVRRNKGYCGSFPSECKVSPTASAPEVSQLPDLKMFLQ